MYVRHISFITLGKLSPGELGVSGAIYRLHLLHTTTFAMAFAILLSGCSTNRNSDTHKASKKLNPCNYLYGADRPIDCPHVPQMSPYMNPLNP